MLREYVDTSNWVHPNLNELEGLIGEMLEGKVVQLILYGKDELSFVKGRLEGRGLMLKVNKHDREFYRLERV